MILLRQQALTARNFLTFTIVYDINNNYFRKSSAGFFSNAESLMFVFLQYQSFSANFFFFYVAFFSRKCSRFFQCTAV